MSEYNKINDYDENNTELNEEYQNLEIYSEPIIRKPIYQKVIIRKPIFIPAYYKGKEFQTINYGNIYNTSSQENYNNNNIEYTAPTITPVEDEDNYNETQNQNEYIKNENYNYKNNYNSNTNPLENDYNNINPNENDNIQDEENYDNYLGDNNQNATKEDNNYFNSILNKQENEINDTTNNNNQYEIKDNDNPNNENPQLSEKTNMNYQKENIISPIKINAGKEQIEKSENILKNENEDKDISQSSEPLDDDSDLLKKDLPKKIVRKIKIEKINESPIMKRNISTQTDEDNIFCIYHFNNKKKYISLKKPIDENSNSIYKRINREGFHRVKVTPIYKTKNYKKDYNNTNINNYSIKNNKYNHKFFINPTRKNNTSYNFDSNYFKNRIKKVFMPNTISRKIKIRPIYNIPNKKNTTTKNNRYNNTINFGDISDIKFNNEPNISNNKEYIEKNSPYKMYKNKKDIMGYPKENNKDLKEENNRLHSFINSENLDKIDNNFYHHEKFIEDMKNIFD